MAGWISYKEFEIAFNNIQMKSTIELVLGVARKMANERDQPLVDKMQKEMINNYYAGKCIDIEIDFPDIRERKLWAEMFYETAREIFERRIGIHDCFFWQSQRIYQIYGAGNLFEKSVKEFEPRWFPNIRDVREFDEYVKKI